MKKVYFLLIGSFLLTQLIYSQSKKTVDWEFGVRTGVNFSNISLENDDLDLQSRIGFHFSFFADIQISERFMIVPEAGFRTIGSKSYAGEIGRPLNDFKADWLQAELLFKYELVDDKFFIQGGPQAALQVWSANDLYKHWDIAGVVGLGYKFSPEVALDVRYVYGFLNVLEESLVGEKGKNSFFQLGVSYQID